MASRREALERLSLSDLADNLAGPEPGSQNAHVAMAEFTRRQTLAAQQATEAQIDAAYAQKEAALWAERATEAAQATAAYTRQNARYMLWSVIVLAISSVISLGIAVLSKISN